MHYKQDWSIKQIQSLIQVIIKLFHKKISIDIINELNNFINIHQVNEAENFLFSKKVQG